MFKKILLGLAFILLIASCNNNKNVSSSDSEPTSETPSNYESTPSESLSDITLPPVDLK